MISVKVKFFALIRDILGKDEMMMSLPAESSASAVLDALAVEHPAMNEWKQHLHVAVNWEYVLPDHLLRDQDEVAVIPPVSGG